MIDRDYISRMEVEDGLFDEAVLRADPLWERNWITGDWHRRTPEFVVAKYEALDAIYQQRGTAETALGLMLLEIAPELPPQEDNPFGEPARIGEWWELASFDINNGELVAHDTARGAIDEWKRRFLAWLAEHKPDVLVWRVRPELSAEVRFGKAKPEWRVYARFSTGTQSA